MQLNELIGDIHLQASELVRLLENPLNSIKK